MNVEQTAALLAKIKLGDNREVTELVIMEWHDTIGHLPYEDAVDAVRVHRRDSTEYLMPAHVARIVAQRSERQLPPRVGGCKHREHPHSPGFCVLCGDPIGVQA